MKNFFYILIILPLVSLSQEITTLVDKNLVEVGEQFQISFSANDEMKEFRAPSFNGLRIISGPNKSSSSSVQVINGDFTQSKTVSYNYYAIALNEGELTIGSATAKIKNKKVKSTPIIINVKKANPKSDNNILEIKDKVFIKAHLNKSKIFKGEQIIISYKLYSRINLVNIEIDDLPELNGFWKEKIETSSKHKTENINGIAYNVWEISKMALTPQRSGSLELDPMSAVITVQIKNNRRNNRFNDPFGFFDNYQNIDEKIASKPKTIEVKNLPPEPINFTGAVGKFQLKAEIDKNIINTNEALKYKLILSGTGNLKLIDQIEVNFPNDFEIYDPEITDKTFISNSGTSGKKIFEYLIIPRYEGKYEIPKINFTYFDPRIKDFKNIETKSFNIKVNKGKSDDNAYKSSEDLETKEKLSLSEIKNDLNFENSNYTLINKWWYWLLFISPIILVSLIYTYLRKINKINLNPVALRFKKSLKTAQKRLKNANAFLKENDKENFYEEVEKSLWLYFSDKFNVNLANLSKENINTHFEKNQIKKITTDKFTDLLNDCEFCRFAPSSLNTKQMKEIYEKATQVIIEVENELKK